MMGKAAGLVLEDDMDEAARKLAEPIFTRAKEIAASNDADIETTFGMGNTAKIIIKQASQFDTVVIGSHGGSLVDRVFVGNVAERVFRHSPVPVTVVR